MGRTIAHKFGGTSMGTADRIRGVADILVSRKGEQQIVVVSAMSKVTDALIDITRRAAARDPAWPDEAQALAEKHRQVAKELLGPRAGPVIERLDRELHGMMELLAAQAFLGVTSDDLLDVIQGLGEVFSSMILDAHLMGRGEPSLWLDARDVLVVDKTPLGALVDWELSRKKLDAWKAGKPLDRVIITGFVTRDRRGRVTTLGRNGSDYSGAIFGALFGAEEIQIWTDVDGVLSADPRLVPEAVLLDRMSYSEACELAYFGAKVIHPQTMAPAFERGIPLVIRNTFAPEKPGTRIEKTTDASVPVKGITAFSGLALVNVEGAGMIGVPGTAERAFGALKQAGVSVVMISQGSSEHSICSVVQAKEAGAAKQALEEAFRRELDSKLIEAIAITEGIAVLAVVGDGMAGTPGIAARLFTSLSRANINVRAIAQGSSERNISVAIAASDATRALKAVHAGFYLSALTISVGLIGPGNVGRTFLKQLSLGRERLRTHNGLDLRVRAVATSKKMALSEHHLDSALAVTEATDLTRFAAHVQADHLPHALIVDCSASDAVPELYAEWLSRGIHVVTPNKHAGAGKLERYEAIRRAATRGRFRAESTVGAGLPVITTLRDLIDTGDEVLAIEGIFSGTLAWLFNTWEGNTPFSTLVLEAKKLGYTEPDPRDDLSGMDVARKLVILAREAGWKTTLEAVRVESLVPDALRSVSPAEFLERLPELDGPMLDRLARAKRNGCVLRYVAKLDGAGLSQVGLVELPTGHAFAHTHLTDNVVQFTTARYRTNPLVVQGPGAGPEVTAAGIFADVLRIAASLGAKL
ncbi:MAG: bifunctional aspartate kinase/homoserine dehydrogenase I [Myxococcaceae bacterium]|nr:bifunctional aspartate kinase/homoserine dehydrogenase I [Myxococcaceae bacterium]